MQADERTLARITAGCICKGVKLIRLIEAIDNGARSFAEVAAVTGIGDGSCQGKRCSEKVAALLQQAATAADPGRS